MTSPSRSSLTVLFLVLAAAACSSNSKNASPDAQPDVIPATDTDLASPLDGATFDAHGESQGEAGQSSQLTVSPGRIDLNIVLPAVPSPRQAITVTATSDLSDLTIFLLGDELTLDGTSTCGKTLAAGTSCVVAITFLSPTIGTKSDSVVILAGGQSTVVPVTAKVQAASHLAIYPATAQWFPSTAIGQPSTPFTFNVGNTGDIDVGPVTFKVSGANASDFTATATGCDLIVPGDFCAISVLFTPTVDVCTETASLTVTGPAPDFWTASVALSGGLPGTPNPLSLTSPTSDLGSVDMGTTGPAVTFTLHNSGAVCAGNVPIGPLTVTLSSAEFIITGDSCSTNVIPTGGTCTVSVALVPTTAGDKSATLLVTPPSGHGAITSVTGTGIQRIDAGLVEPIDSGLEQGEAGNTATDGSSG